VFAILIATTIEVFGLREVTMTDQLHATAQMFAAAASSHGPQGLRLLILVVIVAAIIAVIVTRLLDPDCLDSLGAEKASRFVRTCDSFGIPLVVIADVPGYLPGVR
jgi:hypothetical protein